MSGNKTSDVLNRINNGMLDHIKPRVAMLMIGTNNTRAGESVEDTVKGIQSVVDKIHEKLPSTRILLLNILPNDIRDWHVRGAQDPKEKWLKDREINKQINAFYVNSSFVTCLNLEKVFLNKDGSINETLYYDPQEVNFLGRKCGPLHPSTAGHTLMAEAIKPVLKSLWKAGTLSRAIMPSLSGSYPFTYQSLKALVFIHGIQRGTGHGEVPEKSLLCQDAHLPPARRHAEHFP